jgi:hypothetical protein
VQLEGPQHRRRGGPGVEQRQRLVDEIVDVGSRLAAEHEPVRQLEHVAARRESDRGRG